MARFLLLLGTVLFVQCNPKYEPKFFGKAIHHDWNGDIVHFNINGQRKEIKLPTNMTVDFNNPIWLSEQDSFFMQKVEKVKECYSYSIVLF